MKNNLSHDVQVADIATYARVSESTLRRIFNTELKVSPNRYLQKLRLNHASELLRNTILPVKEIGFKSGFTSPLYFTLAFKKFTGLTPTHYRRKMLHKK